VSSVSATAAAIVATAGLVLLAAACGGSPAGQVAQVGSTATESSSSTNASAASARTSGAVALSRCMRANGVSKFPDPDSSGKIPKVALEHLGVSDSRFQAAERACRHLLPNGGQPPSQAQVQQVKAQGLRFARCVRSHGVPNFPDPDSSGRIPDPASVGVDQGAPAFRAANQACREYRPPYIPSNAAYDAWAKANG
jgi:hypothetical protein